VKKKKRSKDTVKRAVKAKMPFLHELRRDKEQDSRERNLSGGPYAVFECTAHPQSRIVHSRKQYRVPYEMMCTHCGRRVRAKLCDELSPELWEWYESSVMVATIGANTTT
jgi:hypothetical protein